MNIVLEARLAASIDTYLKKIADAESLHCTRCKFYNQPDCPAQGRVSTQTVCIWFVRSSTSEQEAKHYSKKYRQAREKLTRIKAEE